MTTLTDIGALKEAQAGIGLADPIYRIAGAGYTKGLYWDVMMGRTLVPANVSRLTARGRFLAELSTYAPSFFAPLNTSLVLTIGTGSATFTRATTATVQNNDGYLVQAISGEARFQGARRVRNCCVNSGTLTAAGGWSVSNATSVIGATDPEGGATAYTLTATAPAGFILRAQNAAVIGDSLLNSWYIRRVTGTGAITFYGDTGAEVAVTSSVTSAWSRVTDGVRTATGTTQYIGIKLATSGDVVEIWHPQGEITTSQTTKTTPSEYVSVGVLSSPWHGAGVDSVKYFDVDINGSPIPDSTLKGYKAEGARAQILATADIRDMTTASWTLGATMTRARTSVGADGAANSATRLTGGAVAATNTCLTTIVAAASSRTYSALVKRVTGTGPVRIIQTGTETDISSQINTTTWTQVQLNASVLNVAIGFKIDTNGDAIDVDFNQFEAGAFASSPIAANGTRNADVLTYVAAGNIDGTKGWAYAELSTEYTTAPGYLDAISSGGGTGVQVLGIGSGAASTTAFTTDGSTLTTKSGLSDMASGSRKRVSSWGGSTYGVTGDGLSPATNNFDGTMATTASIGIGCNPLGTGNWFGTIRNVRIGQRQLSAEMQAITT